MLDLISKTPGLQHITEQIFLELNHKNLIECEKVNTSWKIIMNSPNLLLKICVKKRLITQHEVKWLKLIQTLTDPRIEGNIVSYLKRLSYLNIVSKQRKKMQKTQKKKDDMKDFHFSFSLLWLIGSM